MEDAGEAYRAGPATEHLTCQSSLGDYARLYGLTRKQLRYILDPHGLGERELADILDPWEDPTAQGPYLLPAEPADGVCVPEARQGGAGVPDPKTGTGMWLSLIHI